MNKKVVLSVLATAVVASMATSAFAKPSQGLYIGGNIDKYYSITEFVTNEAAVINHINSAGFGNVLYVDDQGKAATITEIVNAADMNSVLEKAVLADFQGNTYTKSDGTTYDPSKDPDLGGATGELKVESVSAINLNQIKVTFNTAVDEDTAADVANYELDGNPLTAATATPDLAELQADGKTVILSLDETGDLAANSAHKLTVSGVKTADGKVTVTDFESAIYVSDSTAPVAKTVKANSTGNGFIVTFDEPVNATPGGVAKIDGVPAVVTAVATDKYSVEVKLATPVALQAGKSYSVYVSAVKDRAGNSSVATTKSYTNTIDTVAPTLQSITQKDDVTLKVKFSEKLGAAPTVTVSRGTAIFANAVAATLDTTDSTGTTYLVTLTTPAGSVDLYPAGQTSTSVVVEVASFKDASNNVAAGTTQNVSLTRNTTAPTVVKTKWDATNTAIIAEFDKTLTTTLDATKLLITDETGADVTADFTAINVDADGVFGGAAANGKYIIFDGASANKTYTFNLMAGYVKDTSVVANYNAATSFTVQTPGTANDTTAPAVETTGATITAELGGAVNPKVDANANVIRVLFTEEVAASATNLSNYKLDGAALPAGSVVTLEKGATSTSKNLIAKITLPASAISYDGNYELTISGVKDAAGNASKAENVVVALKDTVAPVLQSAKIDATGAVLLTFSEAIKSTTASDETDFVVTVNGVQLTTSQFTVQDDATADDKVIKLTFTGVNTIGQNVTVGTASTVTTLTDNSALGNKAKAGVAPVTATN